MSDEDTQEEELEEEVQEEETPEVNPLDMSDEEFAKLNLDDIPEDTVEANSEPSEETSEESEVNTKEDEEEAVETEESTQEESNEEESETEEVEEESQEETAQAEDDYEAVVKKLYSPFKANGREMNVSNVDDAISLMQMGANYNKKMAALKPNLKLVKMLENNDLLDAQKLNYLIDLSNKNPEAITKLISESKIDPLEINTEEESKYIPNSYAVGDKEVDLDNVLNDIQNTPSFNETIDILGNKWDDKSKQVLLENPEAIKTINDHVGSGIYKQIFDVVENERALGRLNGMTDIDAYKAVGEALTQQGYFDQPSNNDQPKEEVATNTNLNNSKSTKTLDKKLESRRKAASPTRAKTTKNSPTKVNPLSMSDDEFEKLSEQNFI